MLGLHSRHEFVWRGATAALLFMATSACTSLSYVDSDHVQHVIGFVDVATPAPDARDTTSVTLTTVGLAIHRRPITGSGISLGYSRETVVSLANGACLDLERGGVCKSQSSDDHSKEASKP